jgi:hypothetical protein
MGEAELIVDSGLLVIRSHFVVYGDAVTDLMAKQIAIDIQSHWNEPAARVKIGNRLYTVQFDISGEFEADLDPEKVWYNDDPRLNFFRIEEYVMGNISFVDGINCNTGYFKLQNLEQTSTTAAHEYGHTIGLDHPDHLDIRGNGKAGIMYPRGTICDPLLQYDSSATPGQPGGTLDPKHRQVTAEDIALLRLDKLRFNSQNKAVVGGFSSIYHEKHSAPPVP